MSRGRPKRLVTGVEQVGENKGVSMMVSSHHCHGLDLSSACKSIMKHYFSEDTRVEKLEVVFFSCKSKSTDARIYVDITLMNGDKQKDMERNIGGGTTRSILFDPFVVDAGTVMDVKLSSEDMMYISDIFVVIGVAS